MGTVRLCACAHCHSCRNLPLGPMQAASPRGGERWAPSPVLSPSETPEGQVGTAQLDSQCKGQQEPFREAASLVS